MPKLLIVDDAAADRVRISGIAARWLDCQIFEAENGQTALTQIETHRPDIVLTDIHMPEMDGMELVSAVKEEYPNIPVILMTAQGNEELAAKALRCGAASYVPKMRLAIDLLDTLNQVYSTARIAQSKSQLMHYMQDSEVSFSLPNDPALIKVAVAHLLDMLRCLPLGDVSERMRVGIAVQEAMLNACYHGNLEITSDEGYGTVDFADIVAARMWTKPYATRQIFLKASISRERAEFIIRDDGQGFDTRLLGGDEEMSKSDGKRGRGVRLMRSIMDDVVFSEDGREVRMIRRAFADDDIDDEDGVND